MKIAMKSRSQHECRMNQRELIQYLLDHPDFDNCLEVLSDGVRIKFRIPLPTHNLDQYAVETNRAFIIEDGYIFFPSNNKVMEKKNSRFIGWLKKDTQKITRKSFNLN